MKVDLRGSKSDDYRYAFKVKVNDKVRMRFYDGEPEDNSLCRNFNDIYNVKDLIKEAYEAGKNGEPLEMTDMDIDWEEI